MTNGLKSNPGAPPGIPAWAVKGAKVVLVDTNTPGDISGPSGAVAGDICILVDVRLVHGIPACRCEQEGGRWRTPPDMWARLARFRPLVTRSSEQDLQEHFRHHLQTRVDA